MKNENEQVKKILENFQKQDDDDDEDDYDEDDEDEDEDEDEEHEIPHDLYHRRRIRIRKNWKGRTRHLKTNYIR